MYEEHAKSCILLQDIAARSNDPHEAENLEGKIQEYLPYLLMYNAEKADILDFDATALFYSKEEHIAEWEISLMALYMVGYHDAIESKNPNPRMMNRDILIKKDGKEIGRFSNNNIFSFWDAPDLKTALGWRIFTDAGMSMIIESYNPKEASRKILDSIKEHGISRNTFEGPFSEALADIFVKGKTSRFGSKTARHLIWKHATKELGREHLGYLISC